MKSVYCFAFTLCATVCLYGQAPAPAPPSKPTLGTMERIKVHGKALEGNLEGDSADRDVLIYLPPSYGEQPNRRYPVVYFLHGYGIGAERYWDMMKVPEAADKRHLRRHRERDDPGASRRVHGLQRQHVLEFADYGRLGSIHCERSGDYVDSHYRTIPDRMSRGLAGHSMGGYGTMRIGMKHPEVFSSLYAMSSCCLTASLNPGGRGGAQAEALKSPEDVEERE